MKTTTHASAPQPTVEDPTGRVFCLSIVVPCYNEERTVAQVVQGLTALDMGAQFEIVAVDDGSSDATAEILDGIHDQNLVVVHHEVNQGKGAAVRTGLARATGTHFLIFDADTEYDINDIPRMVAPILTGRAEVVYGNRMSGSGTAHPSLVHLIGNRVMTLCANVLFQSAISDLHTCLKLLPLGMLNSFQLEETGFGLDTEITAEMLRAGFRPFEVHIGYVGRSKEDGKKIKSSDAVRCIYVLCKVRLRGVTSFGKRNQALAPRTYAAAAVLRPAAAV